MESALQNEEPKEIKTSHLSKTAHCQTCPAFTAAGRCGGVGPARSHIAFVMGPPKIDVTEHNYQAFSDYVGQFFNQVYDQVFQSRSEYKAIKPFLVHAAQCVTDKDETETIKHCRGFVHTEIKKRQCKVIVAMGGAALKSLGIIGSVDSVRGKVLNITLDNQDYLCIPTYNPGALLRKENMGLFSIFEADLHKAMKASVGALSPPKTIAELTKDYKIGKTVDEARGILQHVVDHVLVDPKTKLSLDTETTGLEPWAKDFRCIAFSLAWGEGQSAAFLMNHRDQRGDWQELLPLLKQVLESPNPKIFHNSKYDLQVLELSMGLQVNNLRWDSMFGEYLLNENKVGFYGLKSVVEDRVPEFADYEKDIKKQFHKSDAAARLKEAKAEHKKLADQLKSWNQVKKAKTGPENKAERARIAGEVSSVKAEQERVKLEIEAATKAAVQEKEENANFNFELLDSSDMLLYAAIDADCTRRIAVQQLDEINGEDKGYREIAKFKKEKPGPGMTGTMWDVLLPAARTLGRMEYEGVKVDLDYLSELEVEFQKLMEEAQAEVFKQVGHEFLISSTKQLINVLVSELGLKIETKTKKGGISVGKDSLKILSTQHPVIKPLGVYRKAFSAKNNFLAAIRAGSQADGRIHGRYNQVDTRTGRLSSSSPNMQNIPAKGILGKNIKKLFIPDSPDEVFVNMDYSGAEIRVLTAYAHDAGLIDTLNSGLNIHSDVAAKVFGRTYEEIQEREDLLKSGKPEDKELFLLLDNFRQTAKGMVFLTIYGGGAKKLWENLVKGGADPNVVTLQVCEGYIEKFLNSYPIIKSYMFNIKGDVNAKACTVTKFGRVRRFPLAHFSFQQKNAAYREAINFPIQSTSSDFVISQLCEMQDHADDIGMKLRFTVHDSIGFSVPKANLHLVKPFLDKYAEHRVAEKFPWLPVPFAYEAGYGPSYGECKHVIRKL